MPLKSIDYKNTTFHLSYEIVKNDNSSLSDNTTNQYITILHGWGSNRKLMQQSLQKDLSINLPQFTQVYIDLPGFGNSSNDIVLTTNDYKEIIDIFLDFQSISKDIIMGHSFGGKVATLLKPNHLVLLSSAGIIEDKSFQVKSKILLAKIFNSIGFGKFSSIFRSKDANQMSQNMYETFKNVVDEDFSSIFQSYKGKASIFWGEYDKATSVISGKAIHDFIQNSSFKSYSQTANDDHYFFMYNSNDIAKAISH